MQRCNNWQGSIQVEVSCYWWLDNNNIEKDIVETSLVVFGVKFFLVSRCFRVPFQTPKPTNNTCFPLFFRHWDRFLSSITVSGGRIKSRIWKRILFIFLKVVPFFLVRLNALWHGCSNMVVLKKICTSHLAIEDVHGANSNSVLDYPHISTRAYFNERKHRMAELAQIIMTTEILENWVIGTTVKVLLPSGF